MTVEDALKNIVQDGIELGAGDYVELEALKIARKALEKQIELRKNCEGSCSDCKYRGEFHCANDLLIDSEV